MISGLRLLLMSFLCIACATPSGVQQYALTVKLTGKYELAFLKKEGGDSPLFYKPRLLYNGEEKKIEGYNDENFSGREVSLSPGKKYLKMDHIVKGYIARNTTDSVLYENYGCVIVDIKKAVVLEYFQSACDGNWNKNEEWVSGGTIEFRGK